MVKVAFAYCPDYDPAKVLNAVTRVIDLLGGMERFVKPGGKVVVKPNLLSLRAPEEGVNTHPAVIRAVARLAKDARGRVQIGDSPGGFADSDYIDRIYEISQVARVAREEGVELVKFLTSRSVRGYPVSLHVLEADCVISVPKFKTHDLTVLTAGVKNLFGVVTGASKTEYHLRYPAPDDFARVMADVYGVARPALTVLDCVVAMEGSGPATGELRKMNCIVASDDAVALDAVMATVIGLKPLDVETTKVAYQRGLGEADRKKIEIVGDDIGRFVAKDFKLPQTSFVKLLPKALARALTSLIRFIPRIDEKTCTRCRLCERTCPMRAIAIEDKRCVIDYAKCIRCFCCKEVCPAKAIALKKNIFTRVLWR